MALQQSPLPIADRDGFTLHGELVSIKDGKPWTGRDGVTREPVNVSVLAGSSLRRVQFRSMADAMAWLPADAKRGERIALPVYPRAHGNDLFLDGASAPRDDEPAA
jgi:hypothetical protein